MDTPHRGRFAPSPTGPLHFGSLVAAVGSWMMARRGGGEWLVRMEDVDGPREVPGAAGAQLASLRAQPAGGGGYTFSTAQTNASNTRSAKFVVEPGSWHAVVEIGDPVRPLHRHIGDA